MLDRYHFIRVVGLSVIVIVLKLIQNQPPAVVAVEGRVPLPAAPASVALAYDSRVAAMMAKVTQSLVYTATGGLSGEWPVSIAGQPFIIHDRYSNAGRQQVARYLYEYAGSNGVPVAYDSYFDLNPLPGCPNTVTNVVASLTGVISPTEVVILSAHYDSYSSSSSAADDNASGSAGVMLAARALGNKSYARTLRFVWFDAEERDLCGSYKYASHLKNAHPEERVIADFNLDMIGYDTDSDGAMELHTRLTSSAGYSDDLAVAGVFTNVVSTYGLSGVLRPVIIADAASWSDHDSFWQVGYPAVCAIEDDTSDSNPLSKT